MRILFLIITVLFSVVCFGNVDTTKAPKVDTLLQKRQMDSLNMKIFSTKDVVDYLLRLNNKIIALKELDYINKSAHDKLISEMNKIMQEMDKKRRMK